MNTNSRKPKSHSVCNCVGQTRNGVSLVIIIQLFAVMLIFAFMAINIANLQSHHVNGQIAADLGSRWGVDMTTRTADSQQIQAEVVDIVARNMNVRDPNKVSKILVETGTARPGSDGMEFFKNAMPLNSVRVQCQAEVGETGFMNQHENSHSIFRTSTAVALERDICVVIDRSGSMNFDLTTGNWSNDSSPHADNPLSTSRYRNQRRSAYQWWWYWPHPTQSRWCTMIPALYGLADELGTTKQNELFSIVSYSTDFKVRYYDSRLKVQTYQGDASSEESKPTHEYSTAIRHLEYKYNNDQPVAGGTNISAGIDLAAKVLLGPSARSNAFKTMIVMTDGQYNEGRRPSLAASDAAAQGIEVFTVTFSRHADQNTMIEAAEEGKGQHFHAPDGDALEEIFRKIANLPPAAYIK